jgi:hypothetical protein
MYIFLVYNTIFPLSACFVSNPPEVYFQIALVHVVWLLANCGQTVWSPHCEVTPKAVYILFSIINEFQFADYVLLMLCCFLEELQTS